MSSIASSQAGYPAKAPIYETEQLPASIEQSLRQVDSQVHRSAVLRALSLISAFLFGSLVLLVLASIFLELQSTGSRFLTLTIFLFTNILTIWYLFRRIDDKNSLLSNAWKIEKVCPELEERLSTSVQLSQDSDEARRVSKEMVDVVTQQAEGKLKDIQISDVEQKSIPVSFLIFSASLTGLLVSQFLYFSIFRAVLINTIFFWAPFSMLPLSIEVSPGNVLIEEKSKLFFEASDPFLASPTLEIINDKSDEKISMSKGENDRHFLQSNPVLLQSRYRMIQGIWATKWYEANVRKKPKIRKVKAIVQFPSYTAIKNQVFESVDGPIQFPIGSKIQFELIAFPHQDRATLMVGGKVVVGPETQEKRKSDRSSFRWNFESKKEKSHDLEFVIKSDDGVKSDPFRIEMIPTADTPPTVKILSPSIKVISHQPDRVLDFQYSAGDDFGCQLVEVLLRHQGKVVYKKVLLESTEEAELELEKTESIEFSKVPKSAESVSLSIAVTDNRSEELGGGQRVESEALRIRLRENSSTIGEQTIQKEADWFLNELEKAIQNTKDAIQKSEDLKDALEKAKEGDRPPAKKEEQDLGKSTKKIKDEVEELTEQIEKKAPMFSNRKPELKKLAQKQLADASKKGMEIPLHDEPSKKNSLTKNIKKDLEDSLKKLEQIKKQSKEQLKEMKFAAKLDDLAKRQQRLSDQVEKESEKSKLDKEWKAKQKAVSDEIDKLEKERAKAKDQQLQKTEKMAKKLSEKSKDLAQQKKEKEEIEKKLGQKTPLNEKERNSVKGKLRKILAKQQDSIQKQMDQGDKKNRSGAKNELSKKMEENRKQLEDSKKKLPIKKSEAIEKELQKPGESEKKKDLGKQQSRITKAMKEMEKDQIQNAMKEIEKNIQDEEKSLRDGAKKFSDRPMPDKESKEQAKKALEKVKQSQPSGKKQEPGKASKNIEKAGDQKKSPKKGQNKNQSNSLDQAAKHFENVQKSCENCRNPGSKQGGKSGNRKPSTQKSLKEAAKESKKAANSKGSKQAKDPSSKASKQLNQLAEKLAKESGYCRECNSCNGKKPSSKQGKKPSQKSRGFTAKGASPKPGDASSRNVNIRGGETSNWTRARKKIKDGVLDFRNDSVPQQYRQMVDRYFEELGKLETEKQ